jgi:polyisoprenoid-binding protein YceI
LLFKIFRLQKFFMYRKAISALSLLVSASAVAHAADYTIDGDHSTVSFKVRHLAISSVVGRFTDVKGTFSFDPTKVTDSKAEATIVAKSVNTEQVKRDDHLRSPDFFDIAKFPAIQFKTSKIEQQGANEFVATGDLTIHGVTKPVALNVTFGGSAKDPWGNERVAFEAKTKLDRKDFGLTWNKTLDSGGLVVGDSVEISLEIEGIKKG